MAPPPDPFWGAAARPRIPRWSEARFYGKPRPVGRPPFLLWGALHDLRLGAVLLGLGVFGVFVDQAFFLYQLVIGAPVFEEFAKFGLALVLVAALRGPWEALMSPAMAAVGGAAFAGAMGYALGDWPQAWLAGGVVAGLVLLARLARRVPYLRHALAVPVAFAVGASFGFLEHASTYAIEDDIQMWWRVVFHGGSTTLAMVGFGVLYPLSDVRARWLAWIPASFLHWLNNASAIPVGLSTAALPRGEFISQAWHNGISIALYATALVLLVTAPWVRRGARRWVRRRMPGLRPAARRMLGQAPTDARGGRMPPTGR